MECLGGMGYVEDTPMPMLYREAPLNGIWEGSGNVIALDILRALSRDAAAGAAVQAELQAATGVDRRYDAALRAHRARWPGLPPEAEARWFAERLAVLLVASVLIRGGDGAMADAWVATRVDGDRGAVAGAVAGIDSDAVLAAV
jgi:putative acyl-CoA dehydrogenase